MKRHYISIHGNSPCPKTGQMNQLSEVCIAFDDYRSNLAYLAQPQAPASEMVRQLNYTFFCLLPLPHLLTGNGDQWIYLPWGCTTKISLFLGCKLLTECWRGFFTGLSSPTSAHVPCLQAPESAVVLQADEWKAMPCFSKKRGICLVIIHEIWFITSHSASLWVLKPHFTTEI